MPVSYAEPILEASDTVAEGLVIRQTPEPGQYDPNDDIVIQLWISSGPDDGSVEPTPTSTINLAVYLGGRSSMRNRRRYG